MDSTFKNYLETLEKEVETNEIEQNKIKDEITQIGNIQDNLKVLSEQPEWPDSFIPVNNLAYVPGTIIHTGEQYVTLGAEGQVLMSTNETINFLQRKIDRLTATRALYEAQKEQLNKRCEFFQEMQSEQLVPNMPVEITSNAGVAHQTTGGFYEIIETFSEEKEKSFYKKRKASSKKPSKEKTEDSEWFFKRLEELEREENKGDGNVLGEVTAVLQETSLYEKLSQNEVIKKHCNASGATSKDMLNKLIVEALLNEPVISFNSSKSDETSTHNLEAFLDSIENL